MKITYAPNPLRTVIELDEHEKKELWYKLKIEELEEMVSKAHFDLTHVEWMATIGKPTTLEEAVAEAVKMLDPAYWCSDDKSQLDQRVDEMLAYYLADLDGSHCGDCTCFAASCSKCHVEGLLGVDTIKGLGKHSAHKIQCAFDAGKDESGNWLPERTLDEALSRMQARPEFKKPTDQQQAKGWDKVGFDKHIPRWTAEREQAIAWLEAYKAEHYAFPYPAAPA